MYREFFEEYKIGIKDLYGLFDLDFCRVGLLQGSTKQ